MASTAEVSLANTGTDICRITSVPIALFTPTVAGIAFPAGKERIGRFRLIVGTTSCADRLRAATAANAHKK